jgi:methionyl-tRNA formyltransferase
MSNTERAIKLKMIFMGTSDFAATILESLIEDKYNLQAVFTKPDSTVGRNAKENKNQVKILADQHSLPVFQPKKLDAEIASQIKKMHPDIIIVAAYGKIIPQAILEIPGFGCLNIHPSLLPKFRGPSPIQNALLLGEKETGVSIILLNEEMDAGDILNQDVLPIKPSDTAESLHKDLALLGSKMLSETIPLWVKRNIEPIKQDFTKATFCQLIEREDGHLVWENEAEKIINRYRALFPWPGVFSFWDNGGKILRIKFTRLSARNDSQVTRCVGEVFRDGEIFGVQTLKGSIIIESLQVEGKKEISPLEFSNGYPRFVGSILK